MIVIYYYVYIKQRLSNEKIVRQPLLYRGVWWKLSDRDAREAHKGHCKHAGADEGNGNAAHWSRHIHKSQLLAYTGEYSQSQSEAYGGSDGIYHRLAKIHALLYHQDSHTEHCTVGGDKW